MTISAPAKLNLALSVGPPGADGMHPICSWMAAVDLCDTLHVTRLEDDRLSRYAILWHKEARRRSDIDWPITRDLAVRAHLALQQRLGRMLPVQLKLEKRIPVGGGMGGGSSDAAAMLLAVNELFALNMSIADIAEIASTLGSDVPFLVRVLGGEGNAAIVEGLGERIEMLPLRQPLHAVIVLPDLRCPTAEVYQAFDELGRGRLEPGRVRSLSFVGAPFHSLDLFNDLAEPAEAIAPSLRKLRTDVAQLAQREARMTGSGSSLYVVCDDALHAGALAVAIEQQLHLPALAAGTYAGGPC